MARLSIITAIISLLVPFVAGAAHQGRSHDGLAKRLGDSEVAKLARGIPDDDGWVFESDSIIPSHEADLPPEADDFEEISDEEWLSQNEIGPQLDERKQYKKAAVPWPNAIPNALNYLRGTGVFGMYTWSPWCPPEAKEVGIRCFPMFWGWKSIGQWKQYVRAGYSDHALGPNECNQPGQSQLSPGAAAALWRQYVAPLKHKGYTLVSPSTSNAKSAIPWYQAYFRTCPDCWTGRVSAHFYGTNPEHFITYITSVHEATRNSTIWVTEVACEDFTGRTKCDHSQAEAFMSAIMKWMEDTPWIEMYGYFGFFAEARAGVSSANALLNWNGSLNDMGKKYIYSG